MVHRANTAAFLKAQAAQGFGAVRGLAQKAHGVKFEGGIGGRLARRGGREKGTRRCLWAMERRLIGVNTCFIGTCRIIISVIYVDFSKRGRHKK